MTAGNDFDPALDQPTLFSARVTPHRSLNRTGFLVLMAFIGAVSFVAGVAFCLMGAWPVLGFFGLDVLVIYWAFRINFRSADATEDIVVTPSELRVRRVSHRGHVMEWTLNPLWVQLEQTGDPEFGIERLYLVSRGRRVSVGHFLGPDEKASFSKALLAALQTAKRGITYNPINLNGLSEIGWFGRRMSPKSDPMMTLPYMTSAWPSRAPRTPRCATTTRCAAPSPSSRSTGATQPTIEAMADAAAVTPDELHHLFRRWAGLTPKAFMQALTLDHAKGLLRDSASVLDAALDSGLSGPGRLHDLFVTHEAMSPGEWKNGGAGMTLRYGFHASPVRHRDRDRERPRAGGACLRRSRRGAGGVRRHEAALAERDLCRGPRRHRRLSRNASSIRGCGGRTSRCAWS